MPLNRELVERAARALCDFVFSRSERVDAKQLWLNCDEAAREGFRGEATAVIEAVWRFLFNRTQRAVS